MSATRRPLEAAGKLHARVVELTALCAELERARQSAEAALLAKSEAYEALVARCTELAAKLDRQAAENYTDRGNALSRCADDIRLLLVREGGDD